MFHYYILSVGSNCGYENVERAVSWLSDMLKQFCASDLYETPAVCGGRGRYVNAVAAGMSELEIGTFNDILKDFELECGRDDNCRHLGIVPVDIDIVVCDDLVVREWDYRQNFFKTGLNSITPHLQLNL